MAKISATKKLILEDFPGQKPWIDKLVAPINAFFEQVYFALVSGLTLKQNLKAQVFDYVLPLNINYANTIKFNWTLNEPPTAVFIGFAREILSVPTQIGNHSLEWTYADGQIEVLFNGFINTKTYNVRIIGLV